MMQWLSNMENTKPLALVIFFVVFVGILLYVFTGKKRGKRLESYKNIPFLDDDDRPGDKKAKGSEDNG
jgi:cbb3-type cytochrome oxidase subunit 3